MKLTVDTITPSEYYDGRAINYRLHVRTASGQQFVCFDPSGAASCLRPGNRVDGLLTALHYSLVPEKYGENCLTGIVRSSMPVTYESTYRSLMENHFIGLETIDGMLFLFYSEKDKETQPLCDGQIVTLRITGGLYFELVLSDQYAV